MKLFYFFVGVNQKGKKYEFRNNPQYWYWDSGMTNDQIILRDTTFTTEDLIIQTDSIK